MLGILVRITFAEMKRHVQSNTGRKGFISSILPYHCSYLKEVKTDIQKGTTLKAEANAEAMEGCCFLVCSPWLAQSVLL